MRLGIVLFNLGGPDSPDAVEPFLRNLFSDPAIISLPWPLRLPLARLIAGRRGSRPAPHPCGSRQNLKQSPPHPNCRRNPTSPPEGRGEDGNAVPRVTPPFGGEVDAQRRVRGPWPADQALASTRRQPPRAGNGRAANAHSVKTPSTGTWSEGLSWPLTSRCTVTFSSRSAACGESSRWSMRMPSSRSQPNVLKSQKV